MKLFKRSGKARKKWRRKAWLVDPNKTRIVLESTVKPKHVPLWFCKELDSSIKQTFAVSKAMKEYGVPKKSARANQTVYFWFYVFAGKR